MILVTGATGTLGRELVPLLLAATSQTPSRVRVLTRDAARAGSLPKGVEVVVGDLRDDASVAAAVRGCTAVVSAAHGFVGPGNPSPEAIDRDGNRRLVDAAKKAKVDHFVLVSVAGAGAAHAMSLMRAKFAAEEELRASGLPFTIVRAGPFMETWVGILGGIIDEKGHAVVFGPGTNPVSFVSVRDVGALVARSLERGPANEVHEIGGPEAFGFASLAERVVAARSKPAPVKHVPLAALRVMSVLARPFSPGFARQAQAAVLMNTTDMTIDSAERSRIPDVPFTTLADLLERP